MYRNIKLPKSKGIEATYGDLYHPFVPYYVAPATCVLLDRSLKRRNGLLRLKRCISGRDFRDLNKYHNVNATVMYAYVQTVFYQVGAAWTHLVHVTTDDQ